MQYAEANASPVHQPVPDGADCAGVANEVVHPLGLVFLHPQLPASVGRLGPRVASLPRAGPCTHHHNSSSKVLPAERISNAALKEQASAGMTGHAGIHGCCDGRQSMMYMDIRGCC